MKNPSVHLIELRRKNKNSKSIDTGASLEVLLDGKKMRGVRSITINATAGGIATVNLELVGAIKAAVVAGVNSDFETILPDFLKE